MIEFAIAAVSTFFGLSVVVPIVLGLARVFGFYTIVLERQCKVYVLFGKVIGQLDEPGLHLGVTTAFRLPSDGACTGFSML